MQRNQLKFNVAVAFLLLSAAPATAQIVVDGDTIKLDGTTYRLWGIDAAETFQVCADGWAAGTKATAYLLELMKSKRVVCEPKTADRYGRTVAICRADGQDLGAAMVRDGMAYAFVRYSQDYLAQEREARVAGLGVHAHACAYPWNWRAHQRTTK